MVFGVLALLALGSVGPTFTKTVVDQRFLSEGVAVADVDRDGKLDILAGNVWFQAPDWRPHEIAPVRNIDPKTGYSDCFNSWADDVNRDGWPDQIVIGMPGEKAIWRENPKGAEVPWKEHLIWHSAGNESPLYVDLLGNGKRVLVMGTDDEYVAWFEPGPDPTQKWLCHRISGLKGPGSQRYSHGLGIGDLTGDRRAEVITTGGYYVAPKNPRVEQWTLVPNNLGPDCAHMLPLEGSLLTTSAHGRGIWWHRKQPDGTFRRETLDETVGQTHAARFLTLQGKTNLITGKRKWAHPPGVDVGSEEPSWLVRYEKTGDTWTRHLIDEASGVGTQFEIRDMNRDRLEDIIVSNKNGVFLFTQNRSTRAKTKSR